jgi:hypothetical protein
MAWQTKAGRLSPVRTGCLGSTHLAKVDVAGSTPVSRSKHLDHL